MFDDGVRAFKDVWRRFVAGGGRNQGIFVFDGIDHVRGVSRFLPT